MTHPTALPDRAAASPPDPDLFAAAGREPTLRRGTILALALEGAPCAEARLECLLDHAERRR